MSVYSTEGQIAQRERRIHIWHVGAEIDAGRTALKAALDRYLALILAHDVAEFRFDAADTGADIMARVDGLLAEDMHRDLGL